MRSSSRCGSKTNLDERFLLMGTIGVLSLLVVYIVTNLGAAKFLTLDRVRIRRSC